MSVKHLNPRQGITTIYTQLPQIRINPPMCETPKSPPGDYNFCVVIPLETDAGLIGVKHLNPRQGITTLERGQHQFRRTLQV